MGEFAVRTEGLSKRYRIGHQREPYGRLTESLWRAMRSPLRALRVSGTSGYIWALKDVSLEVSEGEVVGIIGRNGAGKTTLLKILSRITEPTEGHAELRGRVGSLLEVGTGFHPELTGGENIYLNGAILGMGKAEISRKFDEIVSFAEVEQFVDTPVKRYSSGMSVRLAFAVAAHLQPEILLVDEVLAVGDLAFQNKCLGKMSEVAQGGRTVLFVSHQMNAVRRLCDRCFWLDGGRIQDEGPVPKVVGAYELASLAGEIEAREEETGPSKTRFLSWAVLEPSGEPSHSVNTFGPVTVKIALRVGGPMSSAVHGISLTDAEGQLIWAWATDNLDLEPGYHEFHYRLPHLPLRPGAYFWQVSIWEDGDLLDQWHCVPEMIIATDPVTHPRDEWTGILNVPCEFQITHSQ